MAVSDAANSAVETTGWVSPGAWPGAIRRWLSRTPLRRRDPSPPAPAVARFRNLTISREAGAGAGTLSRLVATRLDWKVYDHELLEEIARRMEVPAEEVRATDELSPSVIQDWLLPLREEHYAPQEAYLDHLAKLVDAIGQAGQCIIVGRGAGFLLPPESTLKVRIVAPLKFRAARLAQRMNISNRSARAAARDLDRRRAAFERTMYRVDVNDLHNYDIVLDTAALGLTIASELVVRAIQLGLPPKPRRAEFLQAVRTEPEPDADSNTLA
ncbi:cytidylate kinase-like family protein [Isosphaeraceae bacterium EP7]